ncbi:MAG: putative dithiol-disulfide isomerase involved in polyketide biosynthesis [Rhodobacteraceae bacterium HLUCCA12]|nr:MAG: putative dithiol-disulfide isomerase involved in polyketide biosynthesis [Rhodobacteraceae bacterium HLUCCA12]
MITLDIFSDPICPWCYIGKARLDAALEIRPDHPFEINWNPFMLNPDMPPGGMDRRAYLELKFGGQQKAVAAYLPMQRAAEEVSLPLDLARITRTPATRNAHRLIHWADQEGRQSAMVSALFRAYFVEGADIGKPEVLTELAQKAGLDGAMMARLLATDADLDEIRSRDREIRARGLEGVPAFVIAGQHVVTGAQTTPFWLNVIDELAGRA